MISRAALEPVGDQLLLRLAAESAVFDILTDRASLARARELVERSEPEVSEMVLGAFGPFPVIVSTDASGQVGVALDGPDLGPGVRGNQAVVFYPTLREAAELFRVEFVTPAT
jgi:hypothetical protein